MSWLKIAVLFLGMSAAACKPQAKESKSQLKKVLISASTVQATSLRVPNFVVLTGTLRSAQETDVAADTVGKVIAIAIERGDEVKKGAVLAKLDTRTAQLSAAEASSNVALLQTQAAQAKEECSRAENLYKDGTISKAEYDRMSTQCKTSNLSVATAEVRKELAQKTIGDASIRAPFSGQVAERFVNVGEYVRPESRVARVVSLDPLRLELSVPEAGVRYISQKQEVRFDVTAYPGQVFTGIIRYIGAEVRAQSRDLLVEAFVPNKERRLRPGMFAVARVQVADRDATVIPKNAVRREGASERIFLVEDKQVLERIVQLGDAVGDQVEVRRGLAVGEQVVSPLTSQVRDGVYLN